jgi:hypothetical protein
MIFPVNVRFDPLYKVFKEIDYEKVNEKILPNNFDAGKDFLSK